MDSKHVYASMASTPDKPKSRRDFVVSYLSPWVGKVQVNLEPIAGRMGSGRKFAHLPDEGVVLTIDDDLLYGPQYVRFMLRKLEQYPGSVVSLGGREVLRSPEHYYRDEGWCHKHDWRNVGGEDVKVDIPLAGVTAFRAEDVPIRFPEDFPIENADDVCLGVFCARREIPIYSVRPTEPLVTYLGNPEPTIWSEQSALPTCNKAAWVRQTWFEGA